jgi:hypothetical protein
MCDQHFAIGLQSEMPRATKAAGIFREVIAPQAFQSIHAHALYKTVEPCNAPAPRSYRVG